MTRIFGAALAAVLLATPLMAQVTRTNGGIMIDFQGTDLRLAVAALAEAAGINVIYDDLPQRVVNLRTPSPVPAAMARTYLENILKGNGLELVDEGGGLLRIAYLPGQGPAAAPQGPPRPDYSMAQPGGPLQIFTHRLRHAPAEDVARSIGALFGIGGGGVAGDRPRSLTQELRDQAIPPGGAEIPSAQLRAQGTAAGLSSTVQIFADQRTNSLLIRATPSDYATIRDAIEQLDTRPLQVLIEVLIAEVRRNRQFGLGLTVQVPDQQLDRDSDTQVGGELIGGGDGDVVLRISKLGGVDANVVLRALASSGNVSILSRPVVLAQNNEEARILVGDQRPFIQISRALPTDNAARDQVIQYRDVGTQLTIRPTINPDGYVTMTLLQEVSTATNETQFGAPIISTREAETRLLVKNGQTVVIGGLIDQQRSSSNSGIPILKDIPILGNLFRSSSRNSSTTELFLFLTPHVLFSDEEVDDATRRVRERAPRLDRILPDSIPLYWEERADTMAAPRGRRTPPQAQPPQPQPQQDPPAPPSPTAPTSLAPAPASGPFAADRRRGRRSGRRRGRTGR